MNLYYARRGLKIWNGKEPLARFIPIGNGLYSFSANDPNLIEKLEQHPFYKGELSKPETLTMNLPQMKGKVTFPLATAIDKRSGQEMQLPVEVLVPLAVDSFYKATGEIRANQERIVSGPVTSLNSAQGDAEVKSKEAAQREAFIERMKEIEPKVISETSGKVLKTAPSELIEEYYTIKGKLGL